MYDGLILQTRFKALLDAIALNIEANGGISLDFAPVSAALETRIAQDSANGMIDLIFAGADYRPPRWRGRYAQRFSAKILLHAPQQAALRG